MKKTAETEKIRLQFGKSIHRIEVKSETRATITADKDKIVEIADYLYRVLKWRFIIASALETKQGIEIYYHFSNDNSGMIMNIHTILDKLKPETESLTCLFEAANWIEREMHELLGIHFLHHPNLQKLISEGNWAEGVYPYRNN